MAKPLLGTLSITLPVASIGLLVSLAVVLFNLLGQGHAAFNTRSDGLVWGLPIVTYEYFVAASVGLALLALAGLVFGVQAFYSVAKRSLFLAIACLVAGLVALFLEPGHPFRMLWAVPLSFQVISPMWWKGVLYPLYLLALVALFYRIQAGDWDSRTSRSLGFGCLALTLLAVLTSGLVYGMMAMRPFWYDGTLPVYFLAKDALTGVAFLVLAIYLAYGLRQDRMTVELRRLMAGTVPRLFAAALGITLLFVAARTLTGLWSNLDGLQVFDRMVRSPLFHLELWAGLVLPFLLLLMPRLRARVGVQVLAAVLVLAGQFIGHYEFVIGGQLVPLFKGSWVRGFIEYTPSLTEWLLAAVSLCTTVALYALGERRFDLSAMPISK